MANTRDVGLRISIDGEKEYKQTIAELNRDNAVLASELKKVQEQYKGNEDSMEALTAKQRVYEEQLATQQRKVDEIRTRYEAWQKKLEEVKNTFGATSDEYREAQRHVEDYRIKLNNAETAEIKLQRAVEENTRALEAAEDVADDAANAIDDYADSAEDASGKTSIFADVLKADLVHDAISAAIDGLKRVGEMAIEFGKNVVMSYAELEQNLGGSEAVFGEYADTVQRAAEKAYSTMGASESEYLATANKIGALFQGSGLDVERSMELTMQAMARAADAASVMGIDTSAALEAVTGAAKGNYTMMDNLGVKMDATTLKAYALSQGMSKTWEEMSNAEKAEVAMQYFFEQTAQYAGNFEEESRKTISGSIGMLQASVESWIAGLGNSEADIGVLTGNIIDSFFTVVDNTVPVVENVIKSVPEVYDNVMAAVAQKSPELAQQLDSFIKPLGEMLESLWSIGEALWPLLEPVLSNMAAMLSIAADGLRSAADAAANFIGWAVDAINKLNELDAAWQTNDSSGYYVDGFDGSYGYNAAGDTSWRGGLTWVGESGPELVSLPSGSAIYSNQESRQIAAAATDTSRIESLLERCLQRMDGIERELADGEAVRRMA